MDATERVAAFVEALLHGRRPPRFPASQDEAAALRAAVTLAAGRPGADAPNPRFVERLHRQLAEAIELSRQPSTSRRRFLGRLGLPAVGALLGAAVATGVRSAIDRSPPESDEESLVPAGAGAWIAIAPLASLAANQPVRFAVGPVQGFVVRGSQPDTVTAVSAVCTHLGCLLDPNPAAGRLDCPCHGASFSLDGQPLSPTYTRPLPRLQTRINGDQVEVYALPPG